jgi:putative membrane protein
MGTLFAFLHHLMAFTLVAAIAIEFMLVRYEITRVNAMRLLAADAVVGASATVLLVVGLLRVFYFEKGATYYWSSHAFLTKFSLFILIAILSAVPTLEFLSWRKAVRAGEAPAVSDKKLKTVRMILHLELIGIVIILACAAIMAKGGWV